MKSYRLWFEKDREFPRFMRLRFEEVEVSLREVLTRGVHPIELTTDINYRDVSMISERLVKEANDERHLIAELKELGYCPEVSCPPRYCYDDPKLEHTLRSLTEHIFYVERLSYDELLQLARRGLSRKWDHKLARGLLQSVQQDFNSMREFVKSKDKSVKLSGYRDLERYPLDEILRPEDFANHEKAVIHHALPTTNFRSTSFLSAITTGDGNGFLSLIPHIDFFEIIWREYPFRRGTALLENDIRYTCTILLEDVRFVPGLPAKEGVREGAKAIAESWRKDNGRFCFLTPIEKVEEMLEDERCQIYFSSTNYMEPVSPPESEGEILERHVPSFRVGETVTQVLSGEWLKRILRKYGKSMTGRKVHLLERMVELLCERYAEMLPMMEEHFGERQYLRVGRLKGSVPFPGFAEADDLERTVLAMYIVKHLRGNSILDASHENDTYGLEDLAKALLSGEVKVGGAFVAVAGSS